MEIIGFSTLALLAILFIFAPRLGMTRVRGVDADEAQRALLRERLEEISGDDSSDQAQLATDIAADLSQSRMSEEGVTGTVSARTLAILALLLPVFAFLLHNFLVDSERNALEGAENVMALDVQNDADELESWRTRLEAYLEGNPEDGQIQFLLGQVYLKQSKFDQAASAFARTHASSPGDINVRVYWLQSRFLAARGRLDDASRTLANEILADSPNLPIVLEILALDAVAQGQPSQAVAYLNRGLPGLRSGARIESFVGAISDLRKQFELPGISVNIEAEEPPPRGSTLFVVARPVGGGMPYAVVRRPGSLLPLEVRLDDLVSMSEARTLSSSEEFEVVVRLSRSGQAIAQPGDWQWVSEPIINPRAPAEASLAPLQAVLSPP